ncbi:MULTISPECIES: NYN domain-containing protein [unclassified Coleofasciculus]|uniref:NYN domain-containing protein n=1 Tax=unclassified Coleofasciculus TaxID=2692782 RepID=UPI00187DFDF3|nr:MULTISPECIES: NYN domain-containing protein [unclassified Coleofasciculus]MBE9129298.1 NYN domain-containing protein [Coleofasciculus sp. LEGE 07081]MBE9151950.1 NYN domain-containing protein [Coleofasciculus sp. LEGE 07092]
MHPPPPQVFLLVDGYNVIGSWSELKRTRDRHGLEAARQELIETLINYSAFRDYHTQVVFDAYYQKTQIHHEVFTTHLLACYTEFGQTADSYIEKFCASFRHKIERPKQRLIVATSDRAQQLTIMGYGAEWMSSQQLASDVIFTTHRVRRRHRPSKQSRGRFLVNSLDAKAQQRLAEWRKGGMK